jgi:hypothetical protein
VTGMKLYTCIVTLRFSIYIYICVCVCVCACARAMNVGPCHHGMARPQVADGGTASDMEGSCE